MFNFEPGVAIWTLLSFAIVLFIIRRYVYPPVQKILQTRRESVDRSLEEAELKLADAEKRAADVTQRMLAIRQEEERILVEAREKARALYAEQERKALEEIRLLRKSREADLKKLETGFYERTQKEFTELLMQTCERVIRGSLTPELQQRINDQRVSELERIDRM